MKGLFTSKIVSLAVQILATVVGVYALLQPVPPQHTALKQSLGLEMLVQGIQFAMYVWLIISFHLPSMALTRYIDWVLTTPFMLLSLMLYLKYTAEGENATLETLLDENASDVVIVLVANAVMLLFGLLGEMGVISRPIATAAGFVALLVVFYVIYTTLAAKSQDGVNIFIPFAGVWSLYGVAYMFGDLPKNMAYNILDLVAKNVFGFFLTYKVLEVSAISATTIS